MIQRYWYTLFILLGFHGLLLAQESLLIQQLDRTDGLSQNSVIAIAQDEEGYMWFGTRDGLNKYDGYRFTTFRKDQNQPNNSLPSNDIRGLYYDTLTHQLWIGTPNGVSSYNIYTHQFTNYLSNTDDGETYFVKEIFRDRAKNLWLATPKGLLLLDEQTGAAERIPLSTTTKNVRSIYQDGEEILWIGTTKGLFLLQQKAKQFIQKNLEEYAPSLSIFNDLCVKTIEKDKDNYLWFGTAKNGLFQYEITSGKINNFRHDPNDSSSLSYDDVRTIVSAPNGDIYIGTFLGLNRYVTDQQQLSTLRLEQKNASKQGLSNNSIHALFFDKNEALWIGTYYAGINYHDQRLKRFNIHQSKVDQNTINFNVVSSFEEDEEGNLWIGTEGGGLNYLNRETEIYQSFEHQENDPRSLSGNNVKTILQDGKGLWVGTFQSGLCYTENIEKGFEVYQHEPENENTPSNNNIYGLLKRNGDLWIATYSGGLNRMNIQQKTFKYFKSNPLDSSALISNNCRLIFEDYAKDIWVGTDRGLDKLNLDEQEAVTFEHYLKGIKIYSIAQVDEKGLWVGTFSNGLLYFDLVNKTFSNPIEETTLMQGTVYGILVENKQGLWLSTSNGIFHYDIETKTLNTYSTAYGLENLEYNFNAYYKDRQGQFYFGSTNGYINFFPTQIEDTVKYAPLVFTYLDAMGERVNIDDKKSILKQDINHSSKIVLDYNKANFSIGFAELDYFNPKKNRYDYKMEGIDRDWISTQKVAEATYTIQRSGTYTFRLRTSNNDHTLTSKERTITFEVRPPWWKTIWAYLVYAFLTALLFLAIRRYYHLQASYRLEQLSKQKQAEINEMKLRFFTNVTHEFRTPLTLIISPLEDMIRYYEGQKSQLGQLRLIHKNAKRLLTLVNQLLTFRVLESDHIRMKVSEENIVHFVQEIFLTFKDKAERHQIDYQLKSIETEISLWFDKDKMEKVFYNLLSNAFKFTPNGQSISVELEQKDKQVEISVKDTGKGIRKKDRPHIFKRFYEKSNPSITQSSGIGLSMSKQLVELHKGEIVVESEYRIGSTFKVILPKGRAHFKAEEVDFDLLNDNDIKSYTQLEEEAIIPLTAAKIDSDKEVILVVEDNEDIAQYIQTIFSSQYQVFLAANGKIALKTIQDTLPDLIISDVMMPEMDGITFCQRIKSTLATSHIPVILLTARTAAIQELEGLKIGADDYITKPFDPELLRLKVANIITTRQKLHEKIAVAQSFNPKTIELPRKDKAFLQEVLHLMEENIENPDFNIETFAQKLTLSRSVLYKKIKALTNETPKSLMKQMRLKKSIQLLESQQYKISEVAYQVGFSDPKYFAKCFQEKYGCRPSEYKVAS